MAALFSPVDKLQIICISEVAATTFTPIAPIRLRPRVSLRQIGVSRLQMPHRLRMKKNRSERGKSTSGKREWRAQFHEKEGGNILGEGRAHEDADVTAKAKAP